MGKKEGEDSPLGSIFFGLVLIAVGVGCYFWFDHLETEGGSIRIHVVVILIYNLLGKWGVLGVFGGLGVLLLGIGAKGLAAGKPSDDEPPPRFQ